MHESPKNNQKAPWHLWLVGILGFLWNSMGALDYVMTQTKNEAYMSSFTPEQLAFFYGFPSWVVFAWAIAVWGALIGTIFLLLRNGLAFMLFSISLIAMLVTTIHNYGLSNGLQVIGDTFSLVFTGLIFMIALFFFFYSRAMKRAGYLT